MTLSLREIVSILARSRGVPGDFVMPEKTQVDEYGAGEFERLGEQIGGYDGVLFLVFIRKHTDWPSRWDGNPYVDAWGFARPALVDHPDNWKVTWFVFCETQEQADRIEASR